MQLGVSLRRQQEVLPEVPPGYPQGASVEGEWQLPVLESPTISMRPEGLFAFDDLGRAPNPGHSGIHFFRNDEKFQPVVLRPLSYVYKFMEFGFVITPDLSLGDDMPTWMVAHRVFYSRAVGLIWQRRGLRVIPILRWRRIDQIPFIVAGLPKAGSIAVSNYGFRRDIAERMNFSAGLSEILELLKPETVLLYGSLDENLRRILSQVTNVYAFDSAMAEARLSISGQMEEDLQGFLF